MTTEPYYDDIGMWWKPLGGAWLKVVAMTLKGLSGPGPFLFHPRLPGRPEVSSFLPQSGLNLK